LLNVSANDWAVLWDEFLAGHFWIATSILYGLVQITRLTVWAVQMARHSNWRVIQTDVITTSASQRPK